jgi:hypothetical protein
MLELIHPEDREQVGRLLDELRGEPGASRGVDYRMRDRWLEGTVTNLLIAGIGGRSATSAMSPVGSGLKKAHRETRPLRLLFEPASPGCCGRRGPESSTATTHWPACSGTARAEVLALTMWDLYRATAGGLDCLQERTARPTSRSSPPQGWGCGLVAGQPPPPGGRGGQGRVPELSSISPSGSAEEPNGSSRPGGALCRSTTGPHSTPWPAWRCSSWPTSAWSTWSGRRDGRSAWQPPRRPGQAGTGRQLRRYPPDPQGLHPAMRALRSGRAEVTEQGR